MGITQRGRQASASREAQRRQRALTAVEEQRIAALFPFQLQGLTGLQQEVARAQDPRLRLAQERAGIEGLTQGFEQQRAQLNQALRARGLTGRLGQELGESRLAQAGAESQLLLQLQLQREQQQQQLLAALGIAAAPQLGAPIQSLGQLSQLAPQQQLDPIGLILGGGR